MAGRRRRRETAKPWGVGGWLLVVLLVAPIAAAFTLMTVCALATTVQWSWQTQFGPPTSGTLIDTASHTVDSRRGPDETYCYGLFLPEPGAAPIRVRVYVSGRCSGAEDLGATYVPAVGRAVSEAIVPPERVGGPMAFNGLYGMSPGAVVDRNAFVVALWPFLFIVPFTVIVDLVLVVGVLDQPRRRRRARAERDRGAARRS